MSDASEDTIDYYYNRLEEYYMHRAGHCQYPCPWCEAEEIKRQLDVVDRRAIEEGE